MTQIVISIDDNKNYAVKVEGDAMNPLDIAKLYIQETGRLLSILQPVEKPTIIKPTIEVVR